MANCAYLCFIAFLTDLQLICDVLVLTLQGVFHL